MRRIVTFSRRVRSPVRGGRPWPAPTPQHNAERVLVAAVELLRSEPDASVEDIADAAGVSRATVYRHFRSRVELVAAAQERAQQSADANERDALRPPGELAGGPTPLDIADVLNKVPPHLLGEQIVAEAQRLTGVSSVAIYLVDIDGTRLWRLAGSQEFPESLEAPLAVGPEISRESVELLRRVIAEELPGHRDGADARCAAARSASCSPSAPERSAARRARPPGRRLARAGRRLHRRLRPDAPAQGDQRRGRDPAEPAAAADRARRRRRRSPATCCRATRSAATGSTTSRTATAPGSASPTAWAAGRPPPRSARSPSARSGPSASSPPSSRDVAAAIHADDPRARHRGRVRQRRPRPLARPLEPPLLDHLRRPGAAADLAAGRARRSWRIPTTRASASAAPTAQFTVSHRRLEPGERLLLLSDGVLERRTDRRRHDRRSTASARAIARARDLGAPSAVRAIEDAIH